MERPVKNVTETTAEADEDEEAPRPSLSDFLALGLRESQRPPPMVRESQRPPAVAPEHEAASSQAVEPAPFEAPLEAAGTSVEATGPAVEAASDEPFADRPSVRPQTVSVADEARESESDYVVPVARPSRSRIVAGAIAACAFIVVMTWWLSRERKVPSHPDLSRAASTPVEHEPLPPAPPPIAEPVEPGDDTDVELSSQVPKPAGAAAGPESASSAAPPFGPNVARYPDLPTPVLIQLEKDQQESAKPAKSK